MKRQSRERLRVIRGGLPDLLSLDDADLLKQWEEVQSREAVLHRLAQERETTLRDAATAYDEVIDQLNELSHLLRHFRRELARRELE